MFQPPGDFLQPGLLPWRQAEARVSVTRGAVLTGRQRFNDERRLPADVWMSLLMQL